MHKTVNLNGKDYPISFGYGARYEYQEATGNDVFKIGENLDHNAFADLCFYAFKHGYRIAGVPFDLDKFGVFDLLDSDKEAMQKMVNAFADSLPKGEDELKKAKGAAS